MGYDDNGLLLVLGHDQGEKEKGGTNFPVFKPATKTVFPDKPYHEITRNENPELFKKEVDDKLSMLDSTKTYSAALYRQMNILNSTKMGVALVNALKKRKNVKITYDADVVGYEIDEKTKMAKHVKLRDGRIVPCDLVILCNGPEAPYHMASCLQTIFPSL